MCSCVVAVAVAAQDTANGQWWQLSVWQHMILGKPAGAIKNITGKPLSDNSYSLGDLICAAAW